MIYYKPVGIPGKLENESQQLDRHEGGHAADATPKHCLQGVHCPYFSVAQVPRSKV